MIKINHMLTPEGEPRECDECLCDWCVRGTESHGIKLFIGDTVHVEDYDEYWDWETEGGEEETKPTFICPDCEEETPELYEVVYR